MTAKQPTLDEFASSRKKREQTLAEMEASIAETREQMRELKRLMKRDAKREERERERQKREAEARLAVLLLEWMRTHDFIDESGSSVSYYDFVMAAFEPNDEPQPDPEQSPADGDAFGSADSVLDVSPQTEHVTQIAGAAAMRDAWAD